MTDMLTSYDPRTGLPVGEVPITPPEEVPAVVERSRKAFHEWKLLSHQERRTLLKRFKRLVLDEGDHIAEVVRSETGKPLVEAYSTRCGDRVDGDGLLHSQRREAIAAPSR